MKNWKAIYAVAAFLVWALAGWSHAEPAAEPTSYTDELGTIVVTASKVEKPQQEVTQKVTVISEDEIDSFVTSKGNLSELLTFEPGVFVNVLSRNDANWGAVGGLPHKYNTYMLDGLPIDVFVDPQSLDPWAFERIEIQRGPASVLYPNYLFMDFAGNQAPLGGTVNFILRERIDSPMTKLAADYGSYDTARARFYHQNRVGGFNFFMGGQYESSDYTNYGTDPSWLNMIDDPEYRKIRLYGHGTYYFNDSDDHKLSLFAHYTGHSGDAGRPNRDFDHEYQTVNASYYRAFNDKVTLQAKMGYRNYDRTWEEDGYPDSLALASENGVDQSIIPGDITLSVKHPGGGTLTLGSDFQTADYKTYTEDEQKVVGNDANAYQTGVFVQEELAWQDWIFRAGGRWNYTKHEYDLIGGHVPDMDSESWDKFLWSAGVRYNGFENLSIYSNVGTSFVAPGIMSIGGTLNADDRGVSGRNGRLPNPDLEPESGMGVDLGMEFQPTKDWYFGLRGFYNQIDDQIVQIVVSEDPSQSMDINAGETTAYGFEVEAKYRLTQWLQAFANYTYTESNVSNDENPDQDGVEIPFVPKHMGNIGMHLFLPYEVRVSLWLHLAGDIYDSTSKSGRNHFDGYELLNAKVEKTLLKGDAHKLDAYIDLYNLTNNDFVMPWQFQDPGFAAAGGLRLVF